MSRPASKAPKKEAVVAFKVEKELADILDKLPNKSDFIRKAIVAQLSMACPLCHGSGVLPKALHDYYAPLVDKLRPRPQPCASCGDTVPTTPDPGDLRPEDRERLEQFFHGGPIYCGACYQKAPPCDDCGWHIAPGQADEHHHGHQDEDSCRP
jgi:hypothetical protein